MRELHHWRGDRRHAPDAGADAHADAPATRAHDSPKLQILRDPEARKAEFFKYQKKVEAAEARYAEHTPSETRDRPASQIAERSKAQEWQRDERRKPERSWLPTNEITQMAAGIGVALSSVADALNVLPGRWDAVASSFLGAVVASVAWGNKRWRDRHGNRPED
jgi:hypothetical protein